MDGSGRVFRQLLENFYPWEQEKKIERKEPKLCIISFVILLLMHLQSRGKNLTHIKISKNPLPYKMNRLKRSKKHKPDRDWLPPGLSGSGKQWTLDCRRLLQRRISHVLESGQR